MIMKPRNKKILKETMDDINSHIFEAARAGFTGCSYTFESIVPSVLKHVVVAKVKQEYGYNAKLDEGVLKIDWSNKEMKKVLVYSKPDCTQCDYTKRYLEENNIPYKEFNVHEDLGALTLVRMLGYQTLPVVRTGDDDWHSGFRPDLLAKAGE